MKTSYEYLLFPLLLLLSSRLQAVTSHGSHESHDDEHSVRNLEVMERCGTAEAEEADIAIHQRVVEKFLASSSRVDSDVVVPVCFYVIMDDAGTNSLSNSDLQRQLDALNRAFGSSSCCDSSLDWCESGTCSIDTGIKFVMAKIDGNGALVPGATVRDVSATDACVFREVNNAWAYLESSEDTAMKSSLKRGNAKTLDVYFTNLAALGYTYFPWSTVVPGSIKDGVVVQASSIPGGSNVRYNEGDTLAHEVGHWMGVPHTFAGGCTTSDGIDDTPPQGNAYGGCSPSTRPDSCPGGGLDPIFNFMDYSLDSCMFEFTGGQALAMRACYHYFRLGNRWENEVIDLRIGERSAALYLIPKERQVFRIEIRKDSTCTVSANEGNADMYMSLLNPPSWNSQDLCVKNGLTSNESCSTGDISNYRLSSDNGYIPAQENGDARGLVSVIIGALARFIRNNFAPKDDPSQYPSQFPSQHPTQSPTQSEESVTLYVGIIAVGNTPAQNVRVRCI